MFLLCCGMASRARSVFALSRYSLRYGTGRVPGARAGLCYSNFFFIFNLISLYVNILLYNYNCVVSDFLLSWAVCSDLADS